MPGLKQLRKFSDDITLLGNEPRRRVKQGETLPIIPLPKNIPEDDDSEDFVFGLPVIEEPEPEPEPEPSKEENSEDIKESEESADQVESEANTDEKETDSKKKGTKNYRIIKAGREEVKKEPEPEPEPEIDIEAILAQARGEDPSAKTSTETTQAESLDKTKTNSTIPSTGEVTSTDSDTAYLDDIFSNLPTEPEQKKTDSNDINIDDLFNGISLPGIDSEPVSLSPDVLQEFNNPIEANVDKEAQKTVDSVNPPKNDDVPDLEDLPDLKDLPKDKPSSKEEDISEIEDIPELEDISELDNLPEVEETTKAEKNTLKNVPSNEEDEWSVPDDGFGPADESFDLTEDLPENLKETPDSVLNPRISKSISTEPEETTNDDEFNLVNEDAPSVDDSFEMPEFENLPDNPPDIENTSEANTQQESSDLQNQPDLFNLPDIDEKVGNDAFEMPDISDSFPSTDNTADDTIANDAPVDNSIDNNAPLNDLMDFNLPDIQEETQSEQKETTGFSLPIDQEPEPGSFELPPIDDTFNMTSDSMEDLPDDMSASSGDGFEPAEDDSQFSIPGFSDFDIDIPSAGTKKSQGIEQKSDSEKKRTELSDSEYADFNKNLLYYPLNLRIAIQQMVINSDFKDEVVMDVIFKVIHKTPARQLASQLEKLLDTSISVPVNYEKRTYSEYEAYKSSLEYQLKNKIIPLCIASVIIAGFCFLFTILLGKFVVKPVMAEILYQQGYEQITLDNMSASINKFNLAESYKPVKRWFFKYARLYADKKKYDRSASMYRRLLDAFNFDKVAGLEYASMEFNKRANYEKAERILQLDVLDHHINDKNGLLLLGDVYLDWATNLDKSKFENARVTYATLLQLYGTTDEYLSRMLRYFIRTDNLREVIPLKQFFYPRLSKKALPPSDIVEMGGYLFDKAYGYLPPEDEFLRSSIEDVKEILEQGAISAPEIPEASYNLGRYYMTTGSNETAQDIFTNSLGAFSNAEIKTSSRILKHIDTYRRLGELSTYNQNYIAAEERYTEGLRLFEREHANNGLDSDINTGRLYSDMADLDYFISGDLSAALNNYEHAISNKYDTPSIRYRIGNIQYEAENYSEAFGSFIKTLQEKPSERNVLLALGNTLAKRGSNAAAMGYYDKLLDILNLNKQQQGSLLPQVREDQSELVTMYMKASNNLGVTLSRLASQNGDSSMSAQAMLYFSEANRAWDALSRNQQTMVRLEGSNLAETNIKYLTHPEMNYEPAIFPDIPRVLYREKTLEQSAVNQ